MKLPDEAVALLEDDVDLFLAGHGEAGFLLALSIDEILYPPSEP